MKPFTEDSALSWAMQRCSQRECCRQEIVKKLREGQLPGETVENIVARLEREHYIDETRYARAFVHDKVAYDHWGRLKMRAALRMKGIADADIDAALSDIDGDGYREMLEKVLRSKLRSIGFDANDEAETYKALQKLFRFAASRGFEADEVSRAIHRLREF